MAEKVREDNWEVLKLRFEFYKHLSTLSATAALLMVAIYSALDLSSNVAIRAVVLMVATLLLSLIGLVWSLWEAHRYTDLGPRYGSWLLVVLTLLFFFVALYEFVRVVL